MEAQFNSSGGITYKPEHFKIGDGEIVLMGLHEMNTIMRKFGEKLGKKLMKRVLVYAAKNLTEYLPMVTPVGDKDVVRAGKVYPAGTLQRSIGIKAAKNRGSSIPAIWVGYRYGSRYANNKNAWFRHFLEWGTGDRKQKSGMVFGKKVHFKNPKELGKIKPHRMMERGWEATKLLVQQDMIEGLNDLITMEWKGIRK
jgi:hypothetical protein